MANTMYLYSQEKKKWADSTTKATALILDILLSKLKTLVVRKRESHNKNDIQTKKSSKWFIVYLKIYLGLGEKKKG